VKRSPPSLPPQATIAPEATSAHAIQEHVRRMAFSSEGGGGMTACGTVHRSARAEPLSAHEQRPRNPARTGCPAVPTRACAEPFCGRSAPYRVARAA
jgi:hypothetical protein